MPHLTPELLRLAFCPTANDGGDDGDVDVDGGSSWKWHRDHLILGVAARDTCVAAVYGDGGKKTKLKKRKNCDGGGAEGAADVKRARAEKAAVTTGSKGEPKRRTDQFELQSATAADIACEVGSNGEDDAIKVNGEASGRHRRGFKESDDDKKKKPVRFDFIKPSQSLQICDAIASHNVGSIANGNGDRDELASNGLPSRSYMHSYLRVPSYITTMIVPTFTLDCPANEDGDSTSNKNDDYGKVTKAKRKESEKRKDAMTPHSTKNAMPIDTPHGWQKLTPEGYWNAVQSLTVQGAQSECGGTITPYSTTMGSSAEDGGCEGVVGLFDHVGVAGRGYFGTAPDSARANDWDATTHTTAAVASVIPASDCAVAESCTGNDGSKWHARLRRTVQRTNDWSVRTLKCREGLLPRADESNNASSSPSMAEAHSQINFWSPMHLAASCLTETGTLLPWLDGASDVNGACNIAIVGWDAADYGRSRRRLLLRKLMSNLSNNGQSTTERKFMVLAVRDVESILDATREGVSIVGTDMVRLWSGEGKAMCLDLSLDGIDGVCDDARGNEVDEDSNNLRAGRIAGGTMDLKDVRYARDNLALLPGCGCLVCRPREKSTSSRTHGVHNARCGNGSNSVCGARRKQPAPGFTRAYIHHLLRAQEMLAKTLLFVHNLHQTLLLFRRLSQVAALDRNNDGNSQAVDGADCDAGGGAKERSMLEAYCTGIDRQLNSS